ncbi:hypothetical protein KIN20_023265 [Parelaphostrongylus tenuis]|uniref:Uncharacterized protein n=1 Tax=Parelaphostrongylus tenuis TaxID=148309 RepID=A0AAD5MRD9_PARTN|nr:hypothetical protein KIN20_023265 [Parelaphostrongylus tenuis]
MRRAEATSTSTKWRGHDSNGAYEWSIRTRKGYCKMGAYYGSNSRKIIDNLHSRKKET